MSGKYYRHSGKFSLIGALSSLLVGLAGAFVLSWIYGYVMDWNPFVYVSLIAVVVYGFLLGGCVAVGLQMGKVRNTPVALLLTLVVALAGIYGGWVTWLLALNDGQALYYKPADILAVAQTLAENGVWSIFGNTPTASALHGFWLMEAFTILICALAACYFFMTGNAFCETCRRWLEPGETLGVFQVPASYQELKQGLELDRLEVLERLAPSPEGAAVFAELSAESCSQCKTLHLLTLRETTRAEDSEGKTSETSRAIFDRLVVGKGTLERIARQAALKG